MKNSHGEIELIKAAIIAIREDIELIKAAIQASRASTDPSSN